MHCRPVLRSVASKIGEADVVEYGDDDIRLAFERPRAPLSGSASGRAASRRSIRNGSFALDAADQSRPKHSLCRKSSPGDRHVAAFLFDSA